MESSQIEDTRDTMGMARVLPSGLQRHTTTISTRSKKHIRNRLDSSSFDEFLLEWYSVQSSLFKIVLEYLVEHSRRCQSLYRNSMMIKPDYNLYKFTFNMLHIENLAGHLCLYPEDNNAQKRIIFTWLCFVKYKVSPVDKESNAVAPADKVKCIALDQYHHPIDRCRCYYLLT
jgi:hypothetical protein